MRFKHQAGALCALAALAAGLPAVGQVTQLQPQIAVPVAGSDAVNETPTFWFVELNGPPVADGGSAAKNKAEKAAFRGNAAKAGLKYSERYAYDTLFNGLSIAIKPSQIAKLSRIDGVKAVYPVSTMRVPPTSSVSEPELLTALSMTGADIAQSELGLTGNGVKVAVMDTGIDYNHPDLGGCFGAGCRVATGYDFVGDAYDAVTNPNPVPDEFPDDCNGHGTHVAGIIGASGAITGVAPKVTFGAYRVFGCAGSTSADIMIAAMERALADGMQVLNMSIGSAFQWPQYPTAMAASRLVNRGITVVAAQGNDGPAGLYAGGAPGLGEKVIGVASFDNTFTHSPVFTITADGKAISYNRATGSPPAPVTGTFPMSKTGVPSTTNDGCTALPAGSHAGKVVLIRRGTCTFHVKALNAQNAGAAGVVLYNNVAGALIPSVVGTPAITIPVVGIAQVDGVTINDRIVAGGVDMTWTSQVVSTVNANGGLISSFSSYGLSPDLALKPDLGAPGGSIRSTLPLEQGAYGNLSGTSMATPHVAGGVALLLEAKPHTPSQAVRGILQNSSMPKLWSLAPSLGILDNPNRQGAGLVQIDKSILATTGVEPAKLALGESQSGGATQVFTVRNTGASAVTYNLSSENGVTNGPNTFLPEFWESDAAVAFSTPSVTVPAGGSATFSATITPASDPIGGQYGGYIVLTQTGDGQVHRVPFAGFIGDYQSKVVLSTLGAGLPWLMDQSLTVPLPAGTFTMVDDDVAYFVVHLDHQSRWMRMEIVDANNGKSWHRAFQLDYLPRNSTSTGLFVLTWDGITTAGNKGFIVPNGQYVAKVSVLKALGDASNPAHVETWTSPVITINRP